MNFLSLLMRAREKREHLFGDPHTVCFRLFNAGRDGFDGLTVDRYGEYLLVQLFYRETWDCRREILASMESFAAALEVPVKGILVKDRRKPAPPGAAMTWESELAAGEWPGRGYSVMQGGVRCLVDLRTGQNTGLFLDMREVRERLRPFFADTQYLLNLFCYTGIFSIHALLNGAAGATNVDLSKPALARAKKNYAANGLEFDERDFICGDSFRLSKAFAKKGRRFSMVIFDPPTFSRNKGANFSVKKHYPEYLRLLGPVVDGGYALTAVNADFLSRDDYLGFHPRAWENVFMAHESSDFLPGDSPYLKAGLWRIRAQRP